MQSRMDKYQIGENKKFERSRKNTKLYEDVYDDIYRDTTYKNTEVLDSAREINLNKLKDMLDNKYDTRQYRTLKNYTGYDEENTSNLYRSERKSYDINEIINDAKKRRTFMEEAKEKKKYIDFTERNKRYDKSIVNLEKEEKELEELINTMALKKEEVSDELDILSDLRGSANTVVTKPVETEFGSQEITGINSTTNEITNDIEKTLVKADKTFYTDSNMFTKNDFEDFSTLSKTLGKKGKQKKLLIVIIILIVILLLFYFGVTKFNLAKYIDKIIELFKKK